MSGKIHQTAFTYRYLYGLQELRRRMLQGDVGQPYYLRIQYECWEGMEPDYKVGFRDKLNLAGGGMLYDMGSHMFDLARYILGPIEGVTGFSQLIPRQRMDSHTGRPTDVETDDIAGALFIHENGVRGQWFTSRATPSSGDRGYLEIIGPEGALKAALSRGTVEFLRASSPTRPSWEELDLPNEARDGKPHCLTTMMRSFVDACLRGKLDGDVDASFYDGLAAQQGVAAVIEANNHRTWVELK
jgi:predicted dehydrogenase